MSEPPKDIGEAGGLVGGVVEPMGTARAPAIAWSTRRMGRRARRSPSCVDWDALWPDLITDSKGLAVNDVPNITRIITRHPAWAGVFAFDERRERQLMVKAPPYRADIAAKHSYPRPVDDTDATMIGDWLVAQSRLGWLKAPKVPFVEQAIAVACDRCRFDEVAAYLSSLTWDGVPRLDEAPATYLGTPPTAVSRVLFSKWMISAVARAFNPGCQVDHVLILEGAQGLGKSSAIRALAGEQHFSDDMPDIATKEAKEHLLGPWIVELAELGHMNKAEENALKAFVTCRVDRFRHAYARRTTEHPRRCVFAGTTNEERYLRDSTGNGRWWPLFCTRVDKVALQENRDQLWAEAVQRFRDKESWFVGDRCVLAQVEEEQRDREEVDPWTEPVIAYARARSFVTTEDLLSLLCVEKSRQGPIDVKRLHKIMKRAGWRVKRETMGDRRRGFLPPLQSAAVSHADAGASDTSSEDDTPGQPQLRF